MRTAARSRCRARRGVERLSRFASRYASPTARPTDAATTVPLERRPKTRRLSTRGRTQMDDERREALILVADDDPDILELVGFRLEQAGYRALRARDGEEALRLAAEHD